MNRGFKVYFEEGSKIAWKTFFPKVINIFKFYAFILISAFASIFIFLQPLVSLSCVKLIKHVKNNEDISLIDCLDGVEKPKRLWTIFVFQLIITFFLLIFQMPALGLIFSTNLVIELEKSFFIPNYNVIIIGLIIGIVIFYLLYLVISIIVTTIFFPSLYIIEEKENLNVSSLMKKSISISKGNRKTFLAICLALVGILLGSLITFILLLFLISTEITVLVIISIILIVILVLGLIIFTPWLFITCETACYLLYEDIKEEEKVEVTEDNYKDVLLEFLQN